MDCCILNLMQPYLISFNDAMIKRFYFFKFNSYTLETMNNRIWQYKRTGKPPMIFTVLLQELCLPQVS